MELDPQSVKSGPLKAVLHRMLHGANLHISLRPDFSNDSEVTEEKVAFVSKVMTANEELLEETEKNRKKRLQGLGQIGALADFLQGTSLDDIHDKYVYLLGNSKKGTQDYLLQVASKITRIYTYMGISDEESLLEERKPIHVNPEKVKPLEDTPADIMATIAHLRNEGYLGSDDRFAKSLLLLFEQVSPGKLPPDVISKLLEEARAGLKEKMASAEMVNNRMVSTKDVQNGIEFIRFLLRPAQRVGGMGHTRYGKMADIYAAVHGFGGFEETKDYVDSHICLVLDKLYRPH